MKRTRSMPSVTLEGERLFAHFPGDPRIRLLAESRTEFFPEGDGATLTFVRGAQGRVTHLILHVDGQELQARRREP